MIMPDNTDDLLWQLYKDQKERADRLEAEVIRLNMLIQEKTIPALITASEAIKASQEYVRRAKNA